MNARIRVLAPLLVVASGCSATQPATPAPPIASTVTTSPADAAMAGYERYWSVTDSAFAAPGSRDWTAPLRDVATGAALASAVKDVANYASYPAHQEGSVSRAPKVEGVAGGHVQIDDCVALGNSRLIADKTGAVLDDLANRTPRYQFRAEVVNTGGRWLVGSTTPQLDRPC